MSKWVDGDKTETPTTTESPAITENTTARKAGEEFRVKGVKYKVLKVENGGGTIECIGTKDKKCKTITIPAVISDGGDVYKVTSIGKNGT